MFGKKLIFRYINGTLRPMLVDEEYQTEKTEKSTKTTNEYMNEMLRNKVNENKDKALKKDIAEKEKFVEDNSKNELKQLDKEEFDKEKAKKRGKLNDEEVEECHELAEELYEKGRKEEPQISKDMVEIVKNSNGKMFGLDFRLKQPTSLTAKIGDDARQDEISFREASRGCKDVVRYTMIFDEDTFTDKVNQARNLLEGKGYKEYRLKNFYQMFEDGISCQKSIQCVYETKDGYKFELQFHTVNSQGVKELNHPDYEVWRERTTEQQIKDNLFKKMKHRSQYVRNPKGVLTIVPRK